MERLTRAAAVLGIRLPKGSSGLIRYIIVWSIIAASLLPFGPALASGTLTNASVSLSDPEPTNTSNYTFTGSTVDTSTHVLCVELIWSTTASGTTAPTGFSGASGTINAAGSTLINSSAMNWSLAKSDGAGSSGQNNIYKYTNSSAGVVPSTGTGATLEADSIVNSSVANTGYYLQLSTYGNTNCTSSLINSSTVTFINTNGSTMSLTIDPTLSFTVGTVSASTSCDGTTTTQASTSNSIPFGTVTSSANGVVCQDLTAATNATNGYTIYTRWSGPLSSGSNNIANISGSNSSPVAFPAAGTEAYGYTTNDSTLGTGTTNRFTNGGQKWAAMTTSNAEVAYEPTGVTSTSYDIGHQVGISGTTFAGTYTTTVIYTCTPIY